MKIISEDSRCQICGGNYMKVLCTTGLPKKYELERQRRNITPREFYWQCKTDLKRRCNVDLDDWVEYSEWINPTYPEPLRNFNHKCDDGTVCRESYKYQPYDIQLYLQNSYNFIMQFEFDDNKRGFGYMYVVEYDT